MSTFSTISKATQGRRVVAPKGGLSRRGLLVLAALLILVCAATVTGYHIMFQAAVRRDAPVLSPKTFDVVHRSSAWTTLKLFLTLGILSLVAIYGAIRDVRPHGLSALAMR